MTQMRIFCLLFLLLSGPSVSYAGRPLIIDDAYPIEAGQIQIEAGFLYWHAFEHDHYEAPLSLTCGLIQNVEIGAGVGGLIENYMEEGGDTRTRSGIGDTIMTGKWEVMEESSLLPAVALAPAMKLPTADKDRDLGSGEIDYDATVILSKAITDTTGIHANVGYTWIGEPKDEDAFNLFHFGVAGDYQITEPLQAVGEVFTVREPGSGETPATQCNFGMRYEAVEGLVFDAAAGGKLSGDAPSFTVTAGLTWVFGGEPRGS